jgi:hypothetical protein
MSRDNFKKTRVNPKMPHDNLKKPRVNLKMPHDNSQKPRVNLKKTRDNLKIPRDNFIKPRVIFLKIRNYCPNAQKPHTMANSKFLNFRKEMYIFDVLYTAKK